MFSHLFHRPALLSVATLVAVAAPAGFAQQCSTACTSITLNKIKVAAKSAPATDGSLDASTASEFTTTIFNSPGYPLPSALPPGNYPGWCGTNATDSYGVDAYTATSLAPEKTGDVLYQYGIVNGALGTVISPITYQKTWNEVNWLLNHKTGYAVSDVQAVIWNLMGGLRPGVTLNSTQQALYNLAIANPSFAPQPGQIQMILLESSTLGEQHMIVEVPVCGQLGDRVWQDSQQTPTAAASVYGLQDFTTILNPNFAVPLPFFGYTYTGSSSTSYGYTYTEPGINGVTVRLTDSHGNSWTRVTQPSPGNYPFLPKGTNGWYQFTGLCDDTYTVSVNLTDGNNAAVLSGLTKTVVGQQAPSTFPASAGWNSRDQNGAAATLPNPTTGSVLDETLDFGYLGTPTVVAWCPPYPGNMTQAGNYFEAYVSGTGGVPGNPPAPQYTFAMTGLPAGFGLTLDPNTGKLSGTTSTALAPGAYPYFITATDSIPTTSAQQQCTINVVSTQLGLSCQNQVVADVGTFYSANLIGTGGVPPYSYSLVTGPLPGNLTLDTTGLISGTPQSSALSAAGGSKLYGFTAKVTDNRGVQAFATANCGITVKPQLSMDCPAATIPVVQGIGMKPVQLVAHGGSGSYIFTAAGLPVGVSLSPSGQISGTPADTASKTYNVTVTVTDSDGFQFVATCVAIYVNSPITPSCIAIPALDIVQGFSIGTYPASTATGGTSTTYTFTATGLPVGILIGTDGTLSGKPASDAATYTYSVTATDANGYTGSTPCSIVVNPPPSPACVAGANLSLVQGATVTQQTATVSGAGGSGPAYTFTAANLPPTLVMNAATGILSGPLTTSITTATPYPYTVAVTDSKGHAGPLAACGTITVNPKPSLPCASIAAVQYNAISAVTLTATGGLGGPYTFTVTNLPAGFKTAATGATITISGAPQVAPGTYQPTIVVTDTQSGSSSDPITCVTLTVTPPPSLNCATLYAIQGINAQALNLTVTGGAGAPYSASVSGVPNGMTAVFNPSTSVLTISGTPADTVASTTTYPLSITLTDKGNNTNSVTCVKVIVNPKPQVNCLGLMLVQNFPIASTNVAPGLSGYTFSAPALDTIGLHMDSAGNITGTPTISGPLTYTIYATDAFGNAVAYPCSLTVYPPPSTTCATTTAAYATPMTPVALTAAGGAGGPYTFSVAGLPQGIAFTQTTSSTITISGAPLVNGSYPYTVSVTDTITGKVSAVSCSMVVIGGNICGLTWGYWKNHSWPSWPAANGLYVGYGVNGEPYAASQLYSVAQLQTLLGTPVSGDASLDLAHQLIAAKLNVYNGTNLTTDGGAIAMADALLQGKRLPLNVDPSSPLGQQMTAVASQLNYFNSDGKAQPGCVSGR